MKTVAPDSDTDSEMELLPLESFPALPKKRCRFGKKCSLALVFLVLAACCMLVLALHWRRSAIVANSAFMQFAEIKVTPPRDACTKIGHHNCLSSKCCAVSGYSCYEIHSGYAKCMKGCTPGVHGNCLRLGSASPAERSSVSLSATTLFCWSFYAEDVGGSRKSDELDLIRTNLHLGSSIFGCEAWKVYSDVSTWLSPGNVYTVKVDDKDGDFHYAKHKETGTWINAGIFIQVWKTIEQEGAWANYDWTVKVDADTVFLPMRLRAKLSQQSVTDNGIYLENCKYVDYGFFGNLEVFSNTAVATYLANIDGCKMVLKWKSGEGDSSASEPWGEDMFAQRCMDLHGVDKVEAFDITVDGACEAYRPHGQKKNKKWKPDCAATQTAAIHPFKKPNEYFDCLKATQRGAYTEYAV